MRCTLVSWNLNSIRARQDRLLNWLDNHQPDILCLQELKCPDDKFPTQALLDRGYHAAVFGQPTYNGVAIIAKCELSDVVRGMTDDADDPQARLIGATVNGVRVYSAYVPNGGEVGIERYHYKLRWLERLRSYLDKHGETSAPIAVCGDFNVAPEDNDVARIEQWKDSVLCHDTVRAAYRKVCDWGLHDTFRKHHSEGGLYSWWDYRQLAFPMNNGLRIDLILANQVLFERCIATSIDRDERKGKSPSDHVPVMAELDLDGL
jgi:exodeoxyribonuclease-3